MTKTHSDTQPLAMHMVAVPSALASVRSRLSEWLSEVGVAGTMKSDVVLVVDEAVANCVEHAIPRESGATVEFDVCADVRSHQLFVTVSDNGRWRRPASSKGVRGRGIALMAAMMSSVDISTSSLGTTVCLSRSF